jgi:hypothetical protein
MIIVYENQLMKSRDVTIFDGYTCVPQQERGRYLSLVLKQYFAGQVNMKWESLLVKGMLVLLAISCRCNKNTTLY